MKAVVLVFLILLSGCADGVGLINALSPHEGVVVEKNIAYGSQPRQTMDIYRPSKASSHAPVVVFVYGGSWDSGARKNYLFVGNALARKGFIVAIPDYRVYPKVVFPTFVTDVAQAVAAVSRGVGRGHPIILMGHSAGAHIAALVALDPHYLRADGIDPCSRVAGFVGLAGPYDFHPRPGSRYSRIFPQASRAASLPIDFAKGRHPPALLISGAVDMIVNPNETRELAAALKRSGNVATALIYPRIGHITLIGTLAPPLRQFAPTLKDVTGFIRAESRKKAPYCRG